ncbi:MAG TPA: HEPN domain-containing protein, partial [Blastocatellia bacterium]|nr:HEPN domain-containing protein [Blastocatellia bacterium]
PVSAERAPRRDSGMTTEQALLLRKSQDSLQAARLLADKGFWDFSVSRAYYTMFYVAQALLLGEGLTFSKHSAVIAAFGQYFAKTGRVPVEFHRYLIEAEQSRNVGDYDIGPGLSKDEAEQQLTRAEQFIKLAENLMGPIPGQP